MGAGRGRPRHGARPEAKRGGVGAHRGAGRGPTPSGGCPGPVPRAGGRARRCRPPPHGRRVSGGDAVVGNPRAHPRPAPCVHLSVRLRSLWLSALSHSLSPSLLHSPPPPPRPHPFSPGLPAVRYSDVRTRLRYARANVHTRQFSNNITRQSLEDPVPAHSERARFCLPAFRCLQRFQGSNVSKKGSPTRGSCRRAEYPDAAWPNLLRFEVTRRLCRCPCCSRSRPRCQRPRAAGRPGPPIPRGRRRRPRGAARRRRRGRTPPWPGRATRECSRPGRRARAAPPPPARRRRSSSGGGPPPARPSPRCLARSLSAAATAARSRSPPQPWR